MSHEPNPNPDAEGVTPGTNTVIGVVATNARLDKEAINKVAQMGQDGFAQAVDAFIFRKP